MSTLPRSLACRLLLGLTTFSLALCAPVAVASDYFESKVRPILAAKCFTCHTDKEENGLRLDSLERMVHGGDRGPAIVPGHADQSLLMEAISPKSDDLQMPPDNPLESHEIAAIEKWINDGAKWKQTPEDFFLSQVRPVLANSCLSCHGGTEEEGELRIDTLEAILKGGENGPAIVPGKPDESLLIKAIQLEHTDLQMPPEEDDPLKKEEVANLVRWVKDGAVWSGPAIKAVGDAAIEEHRNTFWALQPVKNPAVPKIAHKDWVRNPIDAFVAARLEDKKLTPDKVADKRTLLRRATYDLIGLPPSQQEVNDFLADDSPQAFEKVVERLLASPHYGEHWGRHWLDLVRYADTAGDGADYPVPEAYKYRNYVIDSINRDTPYNEFVREQIAGDLLPSDNDDERWRKQIATGYLAISRRIGVSPQGLRHVTIENTIDNLGKTFMGLTIGCARCHDHKFDPIPTADYYALYGIFDSSVYPHAGEEHASRRHGFMYRVGRGEAYKQLKPHIAQLDPWDKKERAKFDEYQALQNQPSSEKTTTREEVFRELLKIREQRKSVAETFPDLEIAYAVFEGEKPHDVKVQKAGDPEKLGDMSPRGFLQMLGGAKLPKDTKGSGRRELAEWMADAKNPLTARVMVNRIWHHHFGRGIVKSTSDFGIRGAPPTHPELLDYLATYFMENGWSLKQMHRQIMLSRTYQLASSDMKANSAVDPENDLYWRANRRRLSAEQIRDSILTFSDQIDLTPGGRHPMPHHRTYYYRQHEPFAEHYPTNKRSVYMMLQRIQKDPYLDMFDGPDGNLHIAERRATTTTIQALFLMNSEFIHSQAEAIAQRLAKQTDSNSERVEWAYQNIFGRAATAEEQAFAASYFKKAAQQLADNHLKGSPLPEKVWSGYLRGMISSNEFMFID